MDVKNEGEGRRRKGRKIEMGARVGKKKKKRIRGKIKSKYKK